jgi:molybdopterin molybdotransferase
MLSVSEARERILDAITPLGSQLVSLGEAAGRVLADDVHAAHDLPLFDYSSMDGFALPVADFTCPLTFEVVTDIRAGDAEPGSILPGKAARISTGASLPQGAIAVVMLEDTDAGTGAPGSPALGMVTVNRAVRPGENVRRRGEDLQAGEKVLSAGIRLRAQEIGLLAMLGMAEVLVRRRPRLAMLSTGSELLPVEAPLVPGKIHESNSYALAALARSLGAEVLLLGVAPDDREDIRSRLEKAQAAKVDLIVSSAGVSVGAFDFVRSVIEENGEIRFWKVNMRPGKPLAFGSYHGIPFIGLPGNPVSAFIGFEVFIKPALEKLSGMNRQPEARSIATLTEPLESDGRETYLRAITSHENGRLVVRLASHQGSGNIFSLVRANALLIVPSGVKSLTANSDVEIWPIE